MPLPPYPQLTPLDPVDDPPTQADGDSVEVIQPTDTRPHPCVVILTGLDAGQTFRLHPGINVIGRAGHANISITDENISRRHCQIVVRSGREPQLEDLGSTNGTRLNHEVIDQHPRDLQEGDQIRISNGVVLKFSWQHPLEEALQTNLYRAAVRDPLTNIFNKRYFLERFDQEFAWANRHERPLCLAIIDLDHFKRVNDTWGHDAGDTVLRGIAGFLQEQLRREDLAARFGGEEFVLLLRETDIYRAHGACERIREGIERMPFIYEGKHIPVTASLGIASSQEVGIETTMDLFIRADRLLYEAKQAGRNRVAWRPPERAVARG